MSSAARAEVRPVGIVIGLGVAALKGAAHAHPDHIVIADHEVVGDRRWALITERNGQLRVLRTVECPAVMTVHAQRAGDGALWLELPGQRCFLVPAPEGPAVVAEYWGRSTPVHQTAGPWNDALSDLLGRTVRLVAVERPGEVVYADPVSLVTTSSVREVARRAGIDAVNDERFRSSIVVDTRDLPPFTEAQWVGRRLRIGPVELLVRRELARCGVIRFEPGTGRTVGPDLLRVLAADRSAAAGVVFGVGAEVVAPGRISLGDAAGLVNLAGGQGRVQGAPALTRIPRASSRER